MGWRLYSSSIVPGLLTGRNHEDKACVLLQGQTLLSLAAEEGRKESVEYLLKHGAQADVQVTDRKVSNVCHWFLPPVIDCMD